MTTIDTNLIGQQLYVNKYRNWERGDQHKSYLLGTIVAYDASSILVIDNSSNKFTRCDLTADTRDTYSLKPEFVNNITSM